jgi:5'-methylthioadenosine phosphorylase
MAQFGVIAGSGLYDVPGLMIKETRTVHTPYGNPSATYRIGTLSGKDIAFLPRHGIDHTIQPHNINYRANVWGFKELGVKRLIAVGASGGISSDMNPGKIAALDQLIDVTHGRPSTFYDENRVVHIDFTEPFCPDLRENIFRASEKSAVDVARRGTYICTNGPRLETAAEIKAFSLLGADMVGMTAMPEAVLARELEMCFLFITVITNYAAGLAGSTLTTKEVLHEMERSSARLKSLLQVFFDQQFAERRCLCSQTLQDASM